MKKALALFLLMGVCVGVAFARSPEPVTTLSNGNQVNVNYEDQTNMGKLALWGNTNVGNPAYVALKGCDSGNACFPYYLWVASDGKLYIASYITIAAYASFPSGNWNRSNMPVGTSVGSQ